jgi:DNA helicase-2/ATP-dependent DNA helicase PcrA
MRSLFGSSMHGIPSRFLAELPESLLDDVSPPTWRAARGDPAERLELAESEGRTFGRGAPPPRPPSTGAEQLGLEPGDEVVHARWGRGTVVSVEGEGATARGQVRFDTVGDKQLLFAMAPLVRATEEPSTN